MSKFQVLEDIYRHAADLTPAEFRVLVVLMTYTDENCANAHPSNARLADETGMDVSNVRKRLKRLEELGYIVKTEEGGNQYGHGRANVYRVQVPAQAVERAEELRVKRSGDHPTVEGGSHNPPRGSSLPAKGGNQDPPSGPLPGPVSGPLFHDDLRSSDRPAHLRDQSCALTHTPTTKPQKEQGHPAVLDAIQRMGMTPGSNHTELHDEFYHSLRLYYSEELADYAEHNNWTMSPREADRYWAQAKLGKLLNCARLDGIDTGPTRVIRIAA